MARRPPGQHRQQGARHDQYQRQVHRHECDDAGHRDKVHAACGIVTAKQVGQDVQLHRFPDRQAGRYHQHPEQQYDYVHQALHGVVDAGLVRQLESQRIRGVAQQVARPQRQEMAAEMTGQHAVADVDQTVCHQQPHRRQVPGNRAAQPAAERGPAREVEAEQRRGVVDRPAAHHHADDGEGIDPVDYAHQQRMDDVRTDAGLLSSGHECTLSKIL
ncbi:hypothetical protein CFU_0181 [Collimonas fungivorans Ter331]|uniref:Uncharacterized protein n=1 Tax=Collimonas fungivorans (strain Ter331) TaxID=1005048 RepID=G0AHI0_COLFT|nr:hypothetical protein CFU_0181 [Collimonas fungivorans Ter331]